MKKNKTNNGQMKKTKAQDKQWSDEKRTKQAMVR